MISFISCHGHSINILTCKYNSPKTIYRAFIRETQWKSHSWKKDVCFSLHNFQHKPLPCVFPNDYSIYVLLYTYKYDISKGQASVCTLKSKSLSKSQNWSLQAHEFAFPVHDSDNIDMWGGHWQVCTCHIKTGQAQAGLSGLCGG